MEIQKKREKMYLFIKRGMDVVLSILFLAAASLVILPVAVAILIEDGRPVFYGQMRLTKNGKMFRMWKLRSMRMDAEQDSVARMAVENDERITKVGRFLRRYHLDELPQLLNILAGDMALVGPRPERPELAAAYEKTLPAFRQRLQVKAGLTGYAQVYGEYDTPPEKKLEMDLKYMAERSLRLDWKLLLYTIPSVLLGQKRKNRLNDVQPKEERSTS